MECALHRPDRSDKIRTHAASAANKDHEEQGHSALSDFGIHYLLDMASDRDHCQHDYSGADL